MVDFIETTNTKTATRELAVPIADAATFKGIIESVTAENPFGCTDYIQSGVTHDGL